MLINEIKALSDTSINSLLLLIHRNQRTKANKILLLILQLQNMVTTVDEAIMLVPSIASYLTIGVKNDLILLKLTQSITKLLLNLVKLKMLDKISSGPTLITLALFLLLLDKASVLAKTLLLYDNKLTNQLNSLSLDEI